MSSDESKADTANATEVHSTPVTVVNDATTVHVPAPVMPVKNLQVGDWIAVLYWYSFPLPGQPANGRWDALVGRVISVGPRVCYEVPTTTPSAVGGDTEALHGSPIRFADPDRVFHNSEDALKFAANLKAPA